MKRETFIKWVVGFGGIFYTLTGLTMIGAPGWFFENVGHFPPFNRHYTGDLGTFTIALGIGLLIAVRNPMKHRLFLGMVLLASALHTLNHGYDAVIGGEGLAHWLVDVIPLALFAVALGAVLLPVTTRSSKEQRSIERAGL